MTPTHDNKKGTRYRYYISKKLVQEGRRHAPRGFRVPAADLETIVEDRLRRFLGNEAEVFAAIDGRGADANACAEITARAVDLSNRWPTFAPTEKRAVLLALVERIDVERESLEIRFSARSVARGPRRRQQQL